MTFEKPRYFTVNPNYHEEKVYLPGNKMHPEVEFEDITFEKNNVTECYWDYRIARSLKDEEIIEVTEKEYKTSKNYYKKQISNFIDDLHYLHPLDIEEVISKKVNSVINKEKFLFDLKVAIPKEHKNYDVIAIILDKLNSIGEKPKVTGFISSSLNEKQIRKLFHQLVNKFLEAGTSLSDFKALFSESPKQLKWIDTGITRHEPNKQTIFEFFYLLENNGYLTKDDFDCSASNSNNLYRKLEIIFPDVKKFSASNPFKATQNTRRKEELQSIIASL